MEGSAPTVDAGQGFVLTEDKACARRILHSRLGLESGNAFEYRRVCRIQAYWRQLKLHSFAMLRADFNERVKSAECDMQP